MPGLIWVERRKIVKDRWESCKFKGCRCDAICPRRSRPGVSSGVTFGVMLFSQHVYRDKSYSHGSADGHLDIEGGGPPTDEANAEESRAER